MTDSLLKRLRKAADEHRNAWSDQSTLPILDEVVAVLQRHESPFPKIVCLCGSTRFYKQFTEANYRETMAGHIVLSVGFYPHAAEEMHGEGVGITPKQKEDLDRLHLRKIDLADEVFVLDVGGYIGESTKREIAYAKLHHKPISYLSGKHGGMR